MGDRGKSLNKSAIPLTVLPLLFLLLPLTAFGQDPQEEGHDENVKKLCREAETQYKNKKDRDVERIITICQIFDDIYFKATPLEQKAMVKTLRKAYDIQPFPENSAFMHTAAACLSSMGEGGVDAMLSALKNKNLKVRPSPDGREAMEKVRVKETIIQAIGYSRNTKALKDLYKLLGGEDPKIVSAACRALGCYSELPLEARKVVVEKLIKAYLIIDAKGMAHAEEGKDGEMSKHYELLVSVEVPFNSALHKLTYRTLESAAEWRDWFAENKSKKKW